LLLARLLLRLGIAPPAAIRAAPSLRRTRFTSAVTSVVGRGETLSAALVLGSVLDAVVGGPVKRQVLFFALALLLYFLANLTKESAAVAPALVFLGLAWKTEGSLVGRLSSAFKRGFPFYAGAAGVLAAVFAIRAQVLGGPLKSGGTGIFELENPLAPLPALSRVLNACLVLFRYLGRMVLPLRLSSDESAWSIRPVSLDDALAWVGAGLFAALLAASLWRLRGSFPPALGFLFFAAAALPTSNLLFPTGTIFAERLAYLPSAGFCLIAAWGICGGAAAFDSVSSARLLALTGIVLLLAGRAIVRNPVWASDEALFTNMVRVSPESAKAHYDFAYMSAETGSRRRALEHYTRATAIYPGYWDAWAGRGRMELALGDAAAAEKAYAESLRIHPGYESGYFGLGLAREDRGDREGAAKAYRDGLKWNPKSRPLARRLELLGEKP
jgi:tetratricopeptide (TPR) repeat protein